MKGIAPSGFEWKDGKMAVTDDKLTQGIDFNPDRAKRDWRAIPVVTRGPALVSTDLTVHLPQNGSGFAVAGPKSLDDRYANTRIVSNTVLDGGTLHLASQIWQGAGEVAPDAIAGAKRDALRIAASLPKLTAPSQVTWRWDLDDKQRLAKARPILAAYDEAIQFAAKDDYTALTSKADFLASIYRYDDALKLYDELIDKTPAAWTYIARANVLESLGRRPDAIADLRESYDLDPSNDTAYALAEQLAYAGKAHEALKLLEDLPVDEDDDGSYASSWAMVSGLKGDTGNALGRLTAAVADKPEDSTMLNYECWFRGLFNAQVDQALPGCTRAIERADSPAAALDSRALIQFRLGNYDAALEDYNSVLKLSPDLASSRYMRGVVRLQMGDSAGAADVATAVMMEPSVRDFYKRYGIVPKS
jgi:tetratricopeptide (TPR) repeat protein